MTSLLIVLGPSFAKVRQGLTTMNWSEYNYARRPSHRLCDRWSSGGPAEETAEWMAESSDPKSQRRPPVATLFLRWSSAAPAVSQGDVRKQLTIENLEKPYFIAYRVVDSENAGAGASFGALNRSNSNHFRMLHVEVRVGDYKLDNSHFFFFNMSQGTSMQMFNGIMMLTVEDDYKELRRQLWLATDSVYKKAVEDLSKKRATLQNRSGMDESGDFSKEAPVTTSHELPAAKVDLPKWESEARALSALFRQMPAIHTSTVTFGASNSYTRFLTSEGTSYTRREPSLTFNVSAATQAADGTMLDDFVWFHGRSVAELPSQDELAASIRGLGKYLTELR